jgi:hypothetical protein
MNMFIAKTRWDIMIEGRGLKEVVMLAGAPGSNQILHKIILCGTRYIRSICEALDKRSVIIKRLLMSGGYLTIQNIAECTGERTGAEFSNLCKKKRQ